MSLLIIKIHAHSTTIKKEIKQPSRQFVVLGGGGGFFAVVVFFWWGGGVGGGGGEKWVC